MATPYSPSPPSTPPPAPFMEPEKSAPPPQGNGLAIAGMVLGIIGLVVCWIPYVGVVVSLVGIVLSLLGWRRANLVHRGKGMAIAGFVCALIGVVLGAFLTYEVTKAFKGYAAKGRRSEAVLMSNRIGRSIRTYHMENDGLPPSAALLPGDASGACGKPNNKIPVSSQWASDEGWLALDFQIDDASRYQYRWTRVDGNNGFIEAIGDLDCDGTMSTIKSVVKVEGGIPDFEVGSPSPD